MSGLEEGGLSEEGGEEAPSYGAELGEERAREALENPHIGNGDSEKIDSAAAYEFAYQLANAGRIDSLDIQREYLLEYSICTESELDELTVLCLTVRIGQLIQAISVIKNQIEYMGKELGSHVSGDRDIEEIHSLMLNLHHRRSDVIESIKNRREEEEKKAMPPFEKMSPGDFKEETE